MVGLTRHDRRGCASPAKASKRLNRDDLEIVNIDARKVMDVKTVLLSLLDKVKAQEDIIEKIV